MFVGKNRSKSFNRNMRARQLLAMCIVGSIVFFVVLYMTASCMGGCGAPKHSQGPFITYYSNREWRNKAVKTFLLWTPNFGDPWWGQEGKDTFGNCPHKCQMTINKDELDDADALLFHSRSVWNYFLGYTMPSHHPPHQVWILNNGEPPPHVYLDMKAYNNIFNWTFWYRLEADVPTVTGRMVRISDESITWPNEKDPMLKDAGKLFKNARSDQAQDFNYHKSKDKFLMWVASNCKDQGRRQRVVKRLQKYLDFDTYGACGNKDLPCEDFQCSKYLDAYRFSLAFENSVCRDYVTEKFFLSLERGQIPIVYGGSNYSRFVPTNSFIDVKGFDGIKSLAEYIKKVNADEDLYNNYFWWKKFYKIVQSPAPWCDLCKAVHDKSKPAQVYSDLDGWYRNDTCPQFSITDFVARFVEGMLLKYNLLS